MKTAKIAITFLAGVTLISQIGNVYASASTFSIANPTQHVSAPLGTPERLTTSVPSAPKQAVTPPSTSQTIQKPSPNLAFIPITYFWNIESEATTGYFYGGWRSGASGLGPATLSISQSTSLNISFTDSISGSFPVSAGTIGSSLGVSIGVSRNYGATYSIYIPAGKREQIIYRPYYKQVKVVQREWEKTATLTSKTSTTAVAYVNIFVRWDYSYKSV